MSAWEEMSGSNGKIKFLSDNIEAKRAAASEQLKEQQKKREDQIKEAARLKKEERVQKQAEKKKTNYQIV